MKRILFSLLAGLLPFSCTHRPSPLPLISEEDFLAETDSADRAGVGLFTLRGGGLTAQITNYGGRVVSLWVPDRNGKPDDVVLGYRRLEDYVHNTGERFLGACVGPYANRVAGGSFTLDGKTCQLVRNEKDRTTLHGGLTGLDNVVWDVVEADESHLVLHYLHRDGEEGWPGNLSIRMTYTLEPRGDFKVEYLATTDAPTHINISHHSFFNLCGKEKGSILDHEMCIHASAYTPVDGDLIPTGEIAPVEGTPLDFRQFHRIGERIGDDFEQLVLAGGYDHNWVIDRKAPDGLESAAEVYEPQSGRCMEVLTDQPGMQFYAGNFFDGHSVDKYDVPLRFRESFALETQKFPDTPHQSAFPSTLYGPGDEYAHVCVYRFSVR